jgi:hypothetical protein
MQKPTIFALIVERIYRGGHSLVAGQDLGSVENVRRIIADDLKKQGKDPKGKLSTSSVEHMRGQSADVFVGVNLDASDVHECVPIIPGTGDDLIQVTTEKSKYHETTQISMDDLAKYLTPEADYG